MKDFFAALVEILFFAHTFGFEMIGEFAYWYDVYNLAYAIMWAFCGLILIATVFFLDALIINCFYCLIRRILITLQTKEIKHYDVVGKVISKQYKASYTTYTTTKIGKITTLQPLYHPERYIVQVKYKNITANFYSKSLYDACRKNDPINLRLIQKLDKNKNIIESILELRE